MMFEVNTREIFKTESLAGSRIIINNNISELRNKLISVGQYFDIDENSISINGINTNKISVNTIQGNTNLTLINSEGIASLTLDENGHVVILDSNRELVLDVNNALYNAGQGGYDLDKLINDLIASDKFINNLVTKLLNHRIFISRIIENVIGSINFENAVKHIIDTYQPTPEEYTITVNVKAGQSGMGRVSGGGKFAKNTEITISATPNESYEFVKWNDGNINAVRNITVTKDITYTAEFKEAEYVTINTECNPKEGGTTKGGGNYTKGTPVALEAIANEGFSFVYWLADYGEKIETPKFEFNATSDVLYTANFEKSKVTFTIGIEGETFTLIDKSTGKPTELLPGGSDEITLSAEKINVLFGITDPTKFALIYKDKSKNDIEIKDNTEKAIHYIDGQPVLDIKVTEFGTRGVKYMFTRHRNEGGGGDVNPEPVTTEVGG